MDQLWERLWNAGIPLVILVAGIIWVATQWREDMKAGYVQRDAMIKSINDLAEEVRALIKLKS